MFGHQRKSCPFCHGPLPFGMYVFCSNECQRCWHRRQGTCPKGWSKAEWRQLLASQKERLLIQGGH